MSNETKNVVLRCKGDEILPSHLGIIMIQYEDPYINQAGFDHILEGDH